MSFLFGAGPDIDTQKRLEQEQESTIQGLNPRVDIVDFGKSSLAGMGPQGRDAQLAAIQGYKDIVNAPNGLDAQSRAALNASAQQQEGETAAAEQAARDDAARRGMSSSGEQAAAQEIAAQQGANRANQRGLDAVAMGEQARQAALGGLGSTGAETRAGDIVSANTLDKYNLANLSNKQNMLEQQFQNGLQKAGAYGQNQTSYNQTKAGQGYGLAGNGLLSAQNIGAVAGAMTGGLGSLAGAAGGLFGDLLDSSRGVNVYGAGGAATDAANRRNFMPGMEI